jgi:hypothetical protein
MATDPNKRVVNTKEGTWEAFRPPHVLNTQPMEARIFAWFHRWHFHNLQKSQARLNENQLGEKRTDLDEKIWKDKGKLSAGLS